MHRLVVIDDEYIVVEGIKAMIARQKLDYEVVGAAYDGIHGLEVIRECRPDVVITDIRMPGLDGLSLIEAAKEECKNTQFVVISGYTEFEYARRALVLGVKGYIDKPISIQKLNEVLQRIEQEWLWSEKKHSLRDEENQRQYRELKRLFEASVQSLIKSEAGEFHRNTEMAVKKIRELYPETEDFRRELYKHLCVLCDIFVENHRQATRESLVSFQAMEKQSTPEKIMAYSGVVLSDIEKYLTADQTGSSNRAILEVLSYIEEHYNEEIGLSELADRVGMSTAYLSVLFKSEVGTSYVKYLTEFRIRKAKQFLREGYKVNEVSEKVGYSNYRYFCDIFKKHVGQSPNEYKSNVWK